MGLRFALSHQGLRLPWSADLHRQISRHAQFGVEVKSSANAAVMELRHLVCTAVEEVPNYLHRSHVGALFDHRHADTQHD